MINGAVKFTRSAFTAVVQVINATYLYIHRIQVNSPIISVDHSFGYIIFFVISTCSCCVLLQYLHITDGKKECTNYYYYFYYIILVLILLLSFIFRTLYFEYDFDSEVKATINSLN